jgi:predicted phage terminase large subunit-like protein
VDGEITRLMCFMPPRRGKSEILSRRLPAYIFGRDPDAPVISASYSADLARRMNRDAQRIIDSEEYNQIFPNVVLSGKNVKNLAYGNYLRNSDEFEIVNAKGYYKCAGVGGGLTGRGFKYGIVDDPVKDRAEADSLVFRDKVWEWWTNVFYTRKTPDARIALVMTRWHEDDLAGRLIERAEEGGDHWHIVVFQEEYQEENLWTKYIDSPHVTLMGLDQDKRKEGEVLWPDQFPVEESVKTKASVGSRAYQALYQQSPSPVEGGIVKREWLNYWKWDDGRIASIGDPNEISPVPLDQMTRFGVVDLAASVKEHADYSVIGAFGGYRINRRLFHLDQVRERIEGPDLIPRIRQMIEKWNLAFVLVERVGFQLTLIQQGRREGLPLRELTADRDKIARLFAAVPMIERGEYYLPRSADWTGDHVAELLSFPNAKHDDQVDVCAYACAYWASIAARTLPKSKPEPKPDIDYRFDEIEEKIPTGWTMRD